jgi:hypothetical protein
MAVYALQVRKKDIGFITMLNDGHVPPPSVMDSKNTYIIFEIDDEGKNVTTQFATKREMFQAYDLYARSPQLLHLKKL